MSRQINLAIDDDLWPLIEKRRGLVPRVRWINAVLRQHFLDRGSADEAVAPTHEEKV